MTFQAGSKKPLAVSAEGGQCLSLRLANAGDQPYQSPLPLEVV